MEKRSTRSILFIIILSLMTISVPSNVVLAASESDTIILCAMEDPYYALAEEIAEIEGIHIFNTLEDAILAKPVYLLWVIAPKNLSELVLVDFSLQMAEMPGNISVGIISGDSMEEARRLWARSRPHLLPADDYVIINGNGATQKIGPQIRSGGLLNEESNLPLTELNLIDVLVNKNNVQITLEGTATSWFDQHADITIHAEDLPQMQDTLILHYGCSTFRPWVENAISTACIHNGALAYMGFVYPSIVGTRFGDYDSNGLLYTWEKFPIGHLVQIQNRASMQSYTKAGHFFLLGDPRIYRQGEMPYTIVRDEVIGDERVLEIADLENGLIPIYVEDGAQYEFVSVEGYASSGISEQYFNRYLQMMNINQDKYILIDNHQEQITLTLREHVPILWQFSSNGIHFLDAIIVDGLNADIYLVFIGLILVLLFVSVLRKRLNWQHLLLSAGAGFCVAVSTVLYIAIRINNISTTNAPVDFNILYPAGVFVCVTFGLLLYLGANSRKGKLFAILIANLYSLFTLIFFGIALLVRLIVVGHVISVEKITYPWLFPLQKLLIGSLWYAMCFAFIRYRSGKKVKNKEAHFEAGKSSA